MYLEGYLSADNGLSIALFTKNRSVALERALRSCAEDIPHDILREVIIFDDSENEQIRQENRTIVAASGLLRKTTVRYAGPVEKQDYISCLTERGIPEDVCQFAFSPSRSRLSTIGANRNSALIENPGKRYLSMDDDVICKLVRRPESSDKCLYAPFDSAAADPVYPCELRSFRDQESLQQYLVPSPHNFLQVHLPVLGATVRPNGSLDGSDDVVLMTDPEESQTHGEIAALKCIITLPGLAGDCGWHIPSHYLWLQGTSLNALLESRESYNTALASRIVLRAVKQRTMMRGSANMMSTCVGLDNRETLPPFVPFGRGEDVIFGRMVSMCFPRSCLLHLPDAVQHRPIEDRRFRRDDVFVAALGIDLCVLLAAVLVSVTQNCACDNSTPEKAYRSIGTYLERLGALSPPEANAVLQTSVTTFVDEYYSSLMHSSASRPESPPEWRRDVRQLMSLREKTRQRSTSHLPVEFLLSYAPNEALPATQNFLRCYGRLLNHWPSIVPISRTLSDSGIRISRVLN